MSVLAENGDAGRMTNDVAPVEEGEKHVEETESESTRGEMAQAVKLDMNGHEKQKIDSGDGENREVNVASDCQDAEKGQNVEKCILELNGKAHSMFDVALDKLVGDPDVALSRISEHILTLSCLTKLRAGRAATTGELALAADTYALMASLMIHVAPKDVVDKRAIANVAVDLGLREPPPKKRRIIAKPVRTMLVLHIAGTGLQGAELRVTGIRKKRWR